MCSIVLSCINTTGLTPRPPPPRMVFFFNYVTLALIVCRISAAAVTNFNCAPGNGVDGFGGPYILDSSGMCDYMHVLTVSECKYAAVYNAKNGIDSNDGFGHVAENLRRSHARVGDDDDAPPALTRRRGRGRALPGKTRTACERISPRRPL